MARVMKDSGVEWIGQIPEEWHYSRVGNYFYFKSGDSLTSEEMPDDGKYIVYGANGIRGKYNKYNLDGKYILLGRVGALCGNVHIVNGKKWITEHALIAYKKGNIVEEFMGYVFASMDLKQYSKASAQPVISSDTISSLIFPLPCVDEQKRISEFLDDKIGEVDTIVEKTKASIDEYKKYRKAIVIKAVTKGLHPNVDMKQTDSDWIGEIPAHWDYVRIQRLFETIDERNEDENALLLSLYTALGVKPRNELEEKGNKASTVINYKKVQKNDVIVNKLLAWMGAIGYSDYEGVTSPDYDVYRARKGANVVRNYYNEYFRNTCFNGDCYKYGHGIMLMRWRTYPEEFLRIRVPNPPLEEQQEIADYLAEKCGEIDTLIAKKEAFVEEMEAYKKSLIYEYVTGKKEVL